MRQIKARGNHTHRAWIRSKTDMDVEYEIVQNSNLHLKCSCMSWVFSKETPKTCKHIADYNGYVQQVVAKQPIRTITRTLTIDEAIAKALTPYVATRNLKSASSVAAKVAQEYLKNANFTVVAAEPEEVEFGDCIIRRALDLS